MDKNYNEMEGNMYNTEHFKFHEFACKCCGENLIAPRVMDICEMIRQELGVPVYVNSGYRCVKYNVEVGGVKNSTYVKGLAADISCKLGSFAIIEAIRKLEAEGKIEVSYVIDYVKKNFVHIDIGQKRKNKYAIINK